MGIDNISVLSIMMLLLLIAPMMVLNKKLKIDINNGIAISILRMSVQLFLVGIYLKYLFEFNSILLNIFYVLIMISVAVWSVLKSCKLSFKRLAIPLFLSILIPHFTILIYFNFFVAKVGNVFDAKYMITIGGMMLGNSLSGNIIGLNSFFNNFRDNKKEYFYTLSLGASRFQALMPHIRTAIKASVNPTIASMATIGLVSLPGMMTGQILGGSMPMTAIKYQVAIMIAIFIVKYVSVLLSLFLSIKISFDDYDIPVEEIFRN